MKLCLQPTFARRDHGNKRDGSGGHGRLRHASCTSLGNSGVKSPPDRPRYSFCDLTQCRVVEMDVAIRRGRPPMPEQASCDMQALAVHDRVRGARVSKVMEPGIRHDPGCVARPGIFVLFAIFRSLPFVSVATGAAKTRTTKGEIQMALPYAQSYPKNASLKTIRLISQAS